MATTEVGRVAALWRYPVKSMAGEALAATGVSWHGLAGDRRWVIKCDRGLFDMMPLSLVTEASVAALGELVGADLDVRRFRPNVVITPRGGPWVEDTWVGAVLSIGSTRLRVDKRDGRCVVVGVDPDQATTDPSVLRAIAAEREACFGVYGSVVAPGRIAVGDRVLLES